MAKAPLAAQFALNVDGFTPCSPDSADELLVRWGHYLGPCERPFGIEPWVFLVDNRPMAVAVSASTVSSTVDGYDRNEVVELARLCAAEKWVNRLMLRWWREVGALRWPHWPVRAAVAYSQNDRHEGRLYRFDGWEKRTEKAGGSKGGGTWTKVRADDHEAVGYKTLWRWRYDQSRG